MSILNDFTEKLSQLNDKYVLGYPSLYVRSILSKQMVSMVSNHEWSLPKNSI